jgi:hypothetical protein
MSVGFLPSRVGTWNAQHIGYPWPLLMTTTYIDDPSYFLKHKIDFFTCSKICLQCCFSVWVR